MNIANVSPVIAAFLTGVVGPVVVYYVKYWSDKRKTKSDMLTEALEVSGLVNVKLDDLKYEFEADRVWVAQFHNGGHFYPTGKSIAKFSILYETVSINTTSIQNNFVNIPVNLFSKSINELLQNNIIEIPDFKNEVIATYGLKYLAQESGCKSEYLFAIKSIDDKFIGILGVEYTKKKHILEREQVIDLYSAASSIGGVLMQHLNQK